MAELFPQSGQSADVGGAAPNLRGVFIPGIERDNWEDGFGLVTPFGGGGSLRNYQGFDSSAEVTGNSQLRDLTQALGAFGSGDISIDIGDFAGPQGPPGPAGPAGLGIISGSLSSPNGLFGLDTTLEQIADLGTKVNQMIYTSALTIPYVWTLRDYDSGPYV